MNYLYSISLLFLGIAVNLSTALKAQTVGSVEGNFSLSNTGGAKYSISLICPTGIKEMQPNISLEYNSQSGNGIAGWGWSLGGLSSIMRVPKNDYLASKSASVALDSSDQLMLDGEYLIQQQSWGTDSIEYRIETDPTSRILGYSISAGGPATFKVQRKDGRTLYYGNPSVATSYAQLYSNARTKSGVVKGGWNLYHATDLDDNYMDITYIDGLDGAVGNAVRQISYGGNTGAGKTHDLTLFFDYEIRPDTIDGFVSGYENLQQLRLKNISGSVNGVTQKEYRLAYETGAVSRLSSVTLYDRGIQQYNPLTFAYGKAATGESKTDVSFIENGKTPVGLLTADLDGDGYDELCDISSTTDFKGEAIGVSSAFLEWHKLSNNWINSNHMGFNVSSNVMMFKSSFFSLPSSNTLMGACSPAFGDFNGNGSVDNVFISKSGYNYDITIRDISRDSVLFEGSPYIKNPIFLSGKITGQPYPSLFIIDNTPIASNAGYKYSFVQISGSSNTVGLRNESRYITVPSKIATATLVNLSGIPFYDDLFLQLEDGTNRIMKNQQDEGGAFTGAVTLITTTLQPTRYNVKTFADLNGDGLIDVIFRNNSGNWIVDYNRGKFTFMEKALPINCTSTNTKEEDELIVTDFNNDGLPDIIVEDQVYNGNNFDHKIWSFYLNNGNKFLLVKSETAPNNDGCIGNLLGKGTIEWVHRTSDGKLWITDLGLTQNRNLLTSVNTGMQVTTQLTYKPHVGCTDAFTSSTEEFSFKQYCSLGFLPIKQSTFIVLSNYVDNFTHNNYTYGTLLNNWQHRGVVGFRYQVVTDQLRDLQTVSFNKLYSPTYKPSGSTTSTHRYFLMLPQSVRSYLGTTRTSVYYNSNNDYDYTNSLGTYCIFPRLSSAGMADYVKGLTKSFTYNSYDAYNNILNVMQNSGSIVSFLYKNITNVYANAGSWCPAKATSVEIQSNSIQNSEETESVTHKAINNYDAKGHLIKAVTDAYDTHAVTTEQKDFNSFGNPLTQEITADGVTRRNTRVYSSSGRFLLSETNPLNETSTYTYDEARELLLTKTDRIGTTGYTYNNDYSSLSVITYPDKVYETRTIEKATIGSSSTAVYRTTAKKQGGPQIYTWYDKYGREVSKDFDGALQKRIHIFSEYNSLGLLARRSKPTFSNTFDGRDSVYTYDKYNRLTQIVVPEGTTNITYTTESDDFDNYFKKAIYSPSDTAELLQDNAGRLIYSRKNGKEVAFTYGVENRILKATPEGCSPETRSYDLQGNCTKLGASGKSIINYVYDSWGNLVKETEFVHLSSIPVTTNYTYSSVGLLLTKQRGSESTYYTYDNYHRLVNARKTVNGFHSRTYSYDSYDRKIRETDSVKTSLAFSTLTDYDTYGRAIKTTYPSGYYVTNTYDAYGYLTQVTDSKGHIVWQLLDSDAEGRILKEKKGTLITTNTYDSKGQLLSAKAPKVVNMLYTYSAGTGNLASRTDSICNQKELFNYDILNRLTSWTKGAPFAMNSYDATNGNVYQNGSAETTYDLYGKPNALHETNIMDTNLIGKEDNGAIYTYTDFKKIKSIQNDTLDYCRTNYSYIYGVDEQRFYSSRNLGYYSGNYEREGATGKERHIHYLYTPSGLAGIYIATKDSAVLLNAYTDRQGSLIALAHDTIAVQRLAYNPWGVRRNPYNWGIEDSRTTFIVSRGYTMHEHIDRFKLINMNGRIFDPYTRLFLSLDPYIQAPEDWLNYNRYAYCLNNPLKYTDPSGEFIFGYVTGFVRGLFSNKPWTAFGEGLKSAYNEVKIQLGMFNGSFPQVLSHLTWELPQTLLGSAYSQYFANTFHRVKVEYFDGATFVLAQNAHKPYGMTLGCYINAGLESSVPYSNGRLDVTSSYLLMHEYGHYLQSQKDGPIYLITRGIPSLSAAIGGGLNISNPSNEAEVEKSANQHASEYFYRNYSLNWHDMDYPLFHDFK